MGTDNLVPQSIERSKSISTEAAEVWFWADHDLHDPQRNHASSVPCPAGYEYRSRSVTKKTKRHLEWCLFVIS